ncbi:centromere protein C isoform X2 [Juglans microcarpa x Juglans regia]|uniref:centromere protein C isoform X2 n=1 Tax=Juglans microcarpa x Juglans regia TaxID=2249226 RepID=UPI001B7E5890|nr:centromere protein C isoform X2 [Juglans microcarpa x Juglans regia]
MVAEYRSSDPLDPLSAYSGLCLFPRTFGVAPEPLKSYEPDADLDAIHNRLKTMALKSPSKLLAQAKTITVDASVLLNSEIAKCEEKKVVAAKDKEGLQERRPALGRKRARFSLKPDITQPAVILEPNLDIDRLKDPEEFFSAYERLENATRELQKQIGGMSMDFDQRNPSTTARQRRPGILGRSVRYKHRYSSVNSENNENVVTSQETFESGIVSPLNAISQCENDQNLALQERELDGSMDEPENKVSQILDELLSGNFEDLEGDAAVSLLQKRLQIKPIDLEKLTLPDLQGFQKTDAKFSRQNMPKPRNALMDIGNLLKGISSETPVKMIHEAESSVHHRASPTPPRSPFSPLSLLQRRLLQSKPSSDPFSVPDFGEGDIATAKTCSPEVAIGDFNCTSQTVVQDEQFSEHDADIYPHSNGSNNLEEKVEDMLGTVEVVAQNPDRIVADSNQSSPLVIEDPAVHGLYRASNNIPEQHKEESTKVSLNEHIEVKSRQPREHKRKKLSHRQSLAGAGLLWKSGVRRSTRIRTRPLEYWKGERLLYGRIHESLATVIGLKYASPTKEGGEPTLKVKSYVSDEYKELVELAALH